MDTIRFTYIGPAGSEGALAQELRTQGATSVDYEVSTEKRDLQSTVEFVVAVFTVEGGIKDIIEAVRKITNRFKGSRVEGLDDDSQSGEDSPG